MAPLGQVQPVKPAKVSSSERNAPEPGSSITSEVSGPFEALRAAGAARLFLEVAENNPAATAFYRAAGFEPVGRRAKYYQGEDALVLAKALRAGIAETSK